MYSCKLTVSAWFPFEQEDSWWLGSWKTVVPAVPWITLLLQREKCSVVLKSESGTSFSSLQTILVKYKQNPTTGHQKKKKKLEYFIHWQDFKVDHRWRIRFLQVFREQIVTPIIFSASLWLLGATQANRERQGLHCTSLELGVSC